MRGRLARLRGRLAAQQGGFGSVLLNLLSRDVLDDQAWDEIEDTLITADMGVAPSRQIVQELRTQVKVAGTRSPDEVRGMLRAELILQIGLDTDRSLHTAPHGDRPAVVLVVGVNGTGKTTVCGKLGRALIGEGETVLLGAADTFRAGAVEQLEIWAKRLGVPCVVPGSGQGDPAAVTFDAITAARARGVDTVLIDTAGRLHTDAQLLQELVKVVRVSAKVYGAPAPHEALLVLDGTTGQNVVAQGRTFAAALPLTGLVVTKLDGTAKGGSVVALRRALAVPVRFLATGEGLDDLEAFDPTRYARRLLGP